ncbi:acyltransferase [Actinocrispum sp. NPDC049592]|uniref:acyltransferase family protein n=1 Tax=Actinocrispum sp. NPDC049592 TaxID=3154835 RepID=UPI00341FB5D5
MTTTLSATKPEAKTPPPKRSTRKISWDILRVLAVFGVVVEHVTHQSAINHPELAGYAFSLPLQFGASTMLVISAFFVCVTIGKGSRGKWLWNRVARLLPAYFVAVLVTYVVSRIAVSFFNGYSFADGRWLFGVPTSGNPGALDPWYLPTGHDLLGNLLMIQAWAPSFHWIDASYWTLPIQIIAFAFAAFLFRRKITSAKRLPILLWSLVIIPVVIRYTLRTDDSAQWIKSIFDGLALHRVHLFGVGIAIWLWTRGRMRGWHLASYITAALVAQDAHAYWTDTPSTIAFGVVLLLVVAAAGGPDWDVPLVRRIAPVITWLAGISYGVYLVHQELGFILARTLLDLGASSWERLVASLALAVVLGWLMTRLVERPAHKFLVGAGPAVVGKVRAQIQAGRLGTSPARPVPSPLPVNQASTVGAGPPTSGESLPSVLPASSQLR